MPQATSSATSTQPTQTVFSSRAKIAQHCLPWLRSSRSRRSTNFERNFDVIEVYESDISAIQVATCRFNQEKVVIKAFRKEKLIRKPDLQHKVKLEWEIHASLDHPNIIRPYLAMEEASTVSLFMEYAGDSDAYSYISAKQRLALREQDARMLVAHVLRALTYLHGQGIVHRDIKSENVFRTVGGAWKLGDFGSALRLWLPAGGGGGGIVTGPGTGDERVLSKQPLKLEGTFSFAAPEYVRIWNGFSRAELVAATTFKLDVWSVGALAYDVLCGRAPFATHDSISREAEAAAVLADEPVFPSGLSYDAVSFMRQALEKDPQKRPTVAQLLAHPWVAPLATGPEPAAEQ